VDALLATEEAALCTPSATRFPVFECVCLTPGELCLWGSVGLSAPKPFVLPFSGFQIPCNGVPDLVPLCVPLRCKKTSSSMEFAFLPPPADPFRSPTFHACNTCLDSFSRSRFCLDFGIRFHAFTSFGVRYKVGSLYSSRYTCNSFSLCCSSSCSSQASQFFFFRTEPCNSASANISARTSSWDVLCFRFVSFNLIVNLIDFTYFAI